MPHNYLPLLFTCLCLIISPAYAADSPHACATLSEADAVKLLGGPLGEVMKTEQAPTAQNGNDHTTVCGYFPKGYNLQKADAPPERGILVTFHSMRNKDDAKNYYDNIYAMQKEMAKQTSGAPSAVSGIGESAYLRPASVANSPSKISTLTFLKSNVTASVQVWKNNAPVDEIAKAAAKQLLSKLP